MRKVLTLLLCLWALQGAFATHIVGGDFYYKHLIGNKYSITLKMYVDCQNGNPGAILSDDTAFIAIFDAGTNDLIKRLEVKRTGPIHLSGVAYKCVANPGGVCVDQYNYVFEVDLPKRKGGYIIATQRCCRNNTIKNIKEPDGTGATYWVQIPDRDLVNIDNSPVFKKFPPIYICRNIPLVFDHSATDQDGDSLSYELYQPFNGADKQNPKPFYPSDPPFPKVQWSNGFSTGNQMWGAPILEIDEITVELTVTPTILGQFVCGVKVKEFRNGIFIGETLRDYQFNVVECDAVAVANFVPNVKCSDTVTFTDRSIGATSLTWDFGDPNSGFENNTSMEKNPTHIYSRGGDYQVKLKVWNPACQDEYALKVKIRIKKGFDLGYNKVYCTPIKQSLMVPYTDFTSVLWSTGSKGSFINVKDSGKYSVEAKYGACVIRDTIKLGYNPVSFLPIPDSLFCDKVNADLEVKNRSSKAKILWSIGDTSAKVHIEKEGKYIVRVYNANCFKNDTINLVIARIKPDLGPDLFICNDFNHELDGGLQPAGSTYLWNNGSTHRKYNTTEAGKFWVRTTLKHCTQSDTVIITNSKVKLEIGPDKHFCDSVRILIDAGETSPGATTRYKWSNGDENQKTFISQPGTYWVIKTDNFGCFNSDSISFTMSSSPVISLGEDTVICFRSPIPLSPGDGFSAYLWENGFTEKLRYVEEAGNISVVVWDELGCSGTDTVKVKTDAHRLPDVYIPNAFTPNGDGLNDVFPFNFPVVQNEYNLKIFTRWGEKIYDSDVSNGPWDGTFLNKNSQLDSYIWVNSYRACDGNWRNTKGTVTVVR